MRRRYPWQPCERPPPGTVTLNNSVEYLPTNTYLANTSRGRKGGMGKTKAHGTQTVSYCNNTLQRTASRQLRIQASRCPCWRHRANLSIAEKTADQHCFEVNFASITFRLMKKKKKKKKNDKCKIKKHTNINNMFLVLQSLALRRYFKFWTLQKKKYMGLDFFINSRTLQVIMLFVHYKMYVTMTFPNNSVIAANG